MRLEQLPTSPSASALSHEKANRTVQAQILVYIATATHLDCCFGSPSIECSDSAGVYLRAGVVDIGVICAAVRE